jgi:ubiquinone/menaquinone biosynthesis C-methylase UbiE
MTVDLAAIKARQQRAWSTGDFSVVATSLTIVSEELAEAADLRAGERVLDVATGSGNTALAAARRWCTATGVDFVPALVVRARERSAAEGLPATFLDGDAESLPCDDGAFDAVLSTFGVIFAPDQAKAASELVRVCRPGGRIGLACWTPESFVAETQRVAAKHVPMPPGAPSPFRWGTEAGLRELFGGAISALTVTRRAFVFRYFSVAHYVEFNRAFLGPTRLAFERLDAAGQERLTADMIAVAESTNRSGDQTLLIPSEYLEVVATKA